MTMPLYIENKQDGLEALLAIEVNPPISTSISIGEPPNATSLTPPPSFFKVGDIPCKVRLAFRFRIRPWSLKLTFPDGEIVYQSDEREDGLLKKSDSILVYLDFTKNPSNEV